MIVVVATTLTPAAPVGAWAQAASGAAPNANARTRRAGAGRDGPPAGALRPRVRVCRVRRGASPPPRVRALRARGRPRREAAPAAPSIGRLAIRLPGGSHRAGHLRPLRELPAR